MNRALPGAAAADYRRACARNNGDTIGLAQQQTQVITGRQPVWTIVAEVAAPEKHSKRQRCCSLGNPNRAKQIGQWPNAVAVSAPGGD